MGDSPEKNKTQTPPPPVAAPPAPEAKAPTQQQAPEAPSPVAGVSVLVNGVEVTDMSAVQAHITALETFKNETITDSRKQFVKQLADEGKILAGDDNLTATETFALSLSPEQFSAWKATMEATPKQSMFQPHGSNQGDKSAPKNGSFKDEVADRIAVLEDVVQSLRDSGMSQERIETKDSYKELQQLKSQAAN